jgi:hypothetical protein
LIGKLPPELVGAGGTILVANHLSGGAIGAGLGNIVGGLGESLAKGLAARIPLFGSAFVQPVFVTNMGLGGGLGGGLPGVGKGGSLVGSLAKGAGWFGVGLIIAEGIKSASGESDEWWNNAQANDFRRMGGDFSGAGMGGGGGINWAEKNRGSIDRNTIAAKGLVERLGTLSDRMREARDAGKDKRAEKIKVEIQGLRELLQETNHNADRPQHGPRFIANHDRGRSFRESERESGLDGKQFNAGVTRLQSRISAAIRQEARAERRGNDRNARQAGNKVDRLRDRLAQKIGAEGNQTQNATRATGRDVRSVRSAIQNKDLSVKVNVSNPISIATYTNGVATSIRYGGNHSVTAV